MPAKGMKEDYLCQTTGMKKIGELVSDVLLSKHPDTRDVDVNSIPHYDNCPRVVQ